MGILVAGSFFSSARIFIMSRRRYRLTPEIEEKITGLIRAGAYGWVAAEANGVPQRVFARWLRLGAKKGRSSYRRFYEQVQQARAQARARVEMETREKNPVAWLRHGPGREQFGRPGWTNPVKAPVVRPKDTDPLASIQWNHLWSTILQILSPFPEACEALRRALDEEMGNIHPS